MVSIDIVCVGKLKEKYLKDACTEYQKRLSGYCKFTIYELDEYKLPQNPSPLQIKTAVLNEGKKISGKIKKDSLKISLCIEGDMLSSEKLADYIKTSCINGCSHITFIIGGSWGLSEEVKKESDLKLSMSRMTFPHQLARIILCEQIYRCFNMIDSGKYHK